MKVHNLSKNQALWVRLYKKVDQPGQTEQSQFSVKILGVNFGKSILDNSNRDKIGKDIKKMKRYLEQSETLLEK